MPFSVRHFAEDDKLCHHMTFDVLQDLFPLALLEQVLTDCHAWEKRERALNMVTILYLIIALTLFPRLTVAGVLRRLASGARFLWPDPRVALPTDKRLMTLCESLIADPGSVLTLKEWAKRVGASERTLARLFEQDLAAGVLAHLEIDYDEVFDT